MDDETRSEVADPDPPSSSPVATAIRTKLERAEALLDRGGFCNPTTASGFVPLSKLVVKILERRVFQLKLDLGAAEMLTAGIPETRAHEYGDLPL